MCTSTRRETHHESSTYTCACIYMYMYMYIDAPRVVDLVEQALQRRQRAGERDDVGVAPPADLQAEQEEQEAAERERELHKGV